MDSMIYPFVIVPSEVDGGPVTFGWSWGTSRSSKHTAPPIQNNLHLSNNPLSRSSCGRSRVDDVGGVIYEGVADE